MTKKYEIWSKKYETRSKKYETPSKKYETRSGKAEDALLSPFNSVFSGFLFTHTCLGSSLPISSVNPFGIIWNLIQSVQQLRCKNTFRF